MGIPVTSRRQTAVGLPETTWTADEVFRGLTAYGR
jgi:hypothetical protein